MTENITESATSGQKATDLLRFLRSLGQTIALDRIILVHLGCQLGHALDKAKCSREAKDLADFKSSGYIWGCHAAVRKTLDMA